MPNNTWEKTYVIYLTDSDFLINNMSIIFSMNPFVRKRDENERKGLKYLSPYYTSHENFHTHYLSLLSLINHKPPNDKDSLFSPCNYY